MPVENTDKKNPMSPSSRGSSSVRSGLRSVWKALEVKLLYHIRECHEQRIAVKDNCDLQGTGAGTEFLGRKAC